MWGPLVNVDEGRAADDDFDWDRRKDGMVIVRLGRLFRTLDSSSAYLDLPAEFARICRFETN